MNLLSLIRKNDLSDANFHVDWFPVEHEWIILSSKLLTFFPGFALAQSLGMVSEEEEAPPAAAVWTLKCLCSGERELHLCLL